MAAIVKVGDRHKAVVRIKGKPSACRTFDTRLAALRWAEEKEHELKHRHDDKILPGKTLQDAFDRYETEVAPRKRGARWEIIRLKKLSKLPMASNQVAYLRTADLQEWVDTSPLAPASIRREFALVCAVLIKCRRNWKWMAHAPTRDVELPPLPPGRIRRIHSDEVDRVLEALAYDPTDEKKGVCWELGQAFLLAIETGMRRGEIWSLDWSNVFLDRRFVVLPMTKNGDRREVSLSTVAVEVLKRMDVKANGRVFLSKKESAEMVWRRKIKAAGIVDLHFHDTRHEATTRLAKKLSPLDLARMLGHRDLKSLMIYYNATAEEIAQQLD